VLQGQVWQGLNRDLTGIKIPYWDKIRHLSLQIPEDPSRDFKVLSLTEFSLEIRSGWSMKSSPINGRTAH
jgi:hypothetical protein